MIPHIRLVCGSLDEPTVSHELDLVSELFHRINRVIPENQRLLTLPPEMTAREAIALLRQHGYSQAPVVIGRKVLGVFSDRSFAHRAAEYTWDKAKSENAGPGDLTVVECLEDLKFARVTQEMREVFETMDRDNAVLIGSPENLIGILTPMDFLRYLYNVASPFVMISEIELALRALIRLAVTPDELEELAARSLGRREKDNRDSRDSEVPKTLEAMTFDQYKSIIEHGDNWPKFERLLGGTRTRTATKLRELRDLRNDLFHFKRELTLEDHETLTERRNWLLLRVKMAEAVRDTGGQQ